MPTRAAWTSLLFGGLGLLAARLFGPPELFTLGAGMIVSTVVATAIVRRPVARPDVRSSVFPHQPSEGDRIHIDLEVESPRRSPVYLLSHYVDGRVVARAPVPAMAAGSQYRLKIDLDARERGAMVVGPTTFAFEDPLSLARRAMSVDIRHRVLVHPRRVPTFAPSLRSTEGLLIDALRRARRIAPTDRDFRGVREYQRGDDVRRVNWKASAKRDSLLVNEYESDCNVVLQVIVDVHVERHRGQSFEVAMRIAASLIGALPTSDVRMMLCIGDLATKFGDPLAALDALALAAPFDHATLEPPDSPDPAAVLARVVVTGRVDGSLPSILESLTPASGAGVVIAIEPVEGAVPRGWLSVSCPSLGDFERSWSTFVRSTGRLN